MSKQDRGILTPEEAAAREEDAKRRVEVEARYRVHPDKVNDLKRGLDIARFAGGIGDERMKEKPTPYVVTVFPEVTSPTTPKAPVESPVQEEPTGVPQESTDSTFGGVERLKGLIILNFRAEFRSEIDAQRFVGEIRGVDDYIRGQQQDPKSPDGIRVDRVTISPDGEDQFSEEFVT